MNSNSHIPGAHERQFLRRRCNPLLDNTDTSDQSLSNAQQKDQEEIASFASQLQVTVLDCLELEKMAEVDDILRLKAKLESLYDTSFTLAGDHSQEQRAILEVISTIRRAIEKGLVNEPETLKLLADERAARETHLELMQNELLRDLLREETSISAKELTATLLNEESDSLLTILQFFNDEQLRAVHSEAQELLQKRISEQHAKFAKFQQNLDVIKQEMRKAEKYHG